MLEFTSSSIHVLRKSAKTNDEHDRLLSVMCICPTCTGSLRLPSGVSVDVAEMAQRTVVEMAGGG
jgi:hypothetical protein